MAPSSTSSSYNPYPMINLLLLCSLLLILCPTISCLQTKDEVAATKPNALFVFGDSLFDPGNNAFLNPLEFTPANHYPYGRSYFPISTGRLSDGLIMPDFIAKFAGVNIVLPFLHADANLTQGANFASAGAGVLPENPKAMNLDDQLEALKNVSANWTSTLGAVDAREALMRAVYLIELGGNDYFGFSTEYPNATEAEQAERVQTVIYAFMDAIKEMYALGARKFALQNVAPLGCLPIMKMVNNKVCGDCAELPLKLAGMHNAALINALSDLSSDPDYADFKYGIFDYYTQLGNLIHNPTSEGFFVGDSACCGYGLLNAGGCGTEPYVLCTNPAAYVFFDGGHTTQRTNYILAKMFWDGGEDVVKPYNIKQLFEIDSTPISIESTVTDVPYDDHDEL